MTTGSGLWRACARPPKQQGTRILNATVISKNTPKTLNTFADLGLSVRLLRALEDAKVFLATSGWEVRADALSPITGGDGNIEFLVWATKPA